MAKATVITVEAPDLDPETYTFADEDIETIDVSTYAFTKYNTEGLGNANDQLVFWLKEAREHEREDVRAWFVQHVKDVVQWCARYEFIIDYDLLVLIAAKDDDDEVGYTADDSIRAAAFEALDWSYDNAARKVTDYAIAALRVGVLNAAPDAVSFHVDYTGDESGSMFVDYVTTINGTAIFEGCIPAGWQDPDGEIRRAASDLRGMESECRVNPLVTRVNRSDYDIAIFGEEETA